MGLVSFAGTYSHAALAWQVSPASGNGFVFEGAMAARRTATLAAFQMRDAGEHGVASFGIAIDRLPARAGGFVQGVPRGFGHAARR